MHSNIGPFMQASRRWILQMAACLRGRQGRRPCGARPAFPYPMHRIRKVGRGGARAAPPFARNAPRSLTYKSANQHKSSAGNQHKSSANSQINTNQPARRGASPWGNHMLTYTTSFHKLP
jgi:hypothetical protein